MSKRGSTPAEEPDDTMLGESAAPIEDRVALYFLRHGSAGSRDSWDGPDSARPLTGKGRTLTRGVVDRLAELGVKVDVIVTSPYLRARQTAELAALALGPGRPVENEDALEPGFDIAGLRGILKDNPDARSLMLVGHEPDFSMVVGELVGSADLAIRKSGLAVVELTDPSATHGVLTWLAPPRSLAR